MTLFVGYQATPLLTTHTIPLPYASFAGPMLIVSSSSVAVAVAAYPFGVFEGGLTRINSLSIVSPAADGTGERSVNSRLPFVIRTYSLLPAC